MGPAVELLSRQMDAAYDMLRDRLRGLSQEEQTADGRWDADYAYPDPDPSPFTTIAWRVNHIASCKVLYHEYAFGSGELTFYDLPVPVTVPDALALLDEGQALLVTDVATLDDPDLAQPRLTNWGEAWPAWRIFWTMIHHDLWHGGEIGALRDLYRESSSQQAAP